MDTNLKEYWTAQGLTPDRMDEVLTDLADAAGFVPDTGVKVAKREPQVALELEYLNVVNLKSTIDAKLQVPTGLTLLAGRNGMGKSTLAAALRYALSGKIAGGDEAAIRDDQTSMSVLARFSVGTIGRTVTLRKATRGKKAGKVELERAVDVALPTGNETKPEAAQSAIDQWLGGDVDFALRSCIIQQGEITEILDEQPGKRRELLYAVLGLDHFEPQRILLAKALDAERAKLGGDRMADTKLSAVLIKKVGHQQPMEIRDRIAHLTESLRGAKSQAQDCMMEFQAAIKSADRIKAEGVALKECTTCQVCSQPWAVEAKEAFRQRLLSAYKSAREEAASTQEAHEKAQAKLDAALKTEPEIEALARRLAELETDIRELRRVNDRLAAGETKSEDWFLHAEACVKTFSKGGLPLSLAQSAIQKINTLAIDIYGPSAPSFDPEFRPVAPGGRPHELECGSARERAALALRIAMSMYLQQVRSVRIPLLWVDEVPFQDGQHVGDLVTMLVMAQRSGFDRVVLATCQPEAFAGIWPGTVVDINPPSDKKPTPVNGQPQPPPPAPEPETGVLLDDDGPF